MALLVYLAVSRTTGTLPLGVAFSCAFLADGDTDELGAIARRGEELVQSNRDLRADWGASRSRAIFASDVNSVSSPKTSAPTLSSVCCWESFILISATGFSGACAEATDRIRGCSSWAGGDNEG